MFTTLKNALKIKEIRDKLLFTFAMLVVIRLGSQLPVPGVDRTYFAKWFAAQSGNTFNFFDAFTGGSFLNMSVFALNITPYITSSIIMQLMTIAIPALEEMQKEGEDGRKKIVGDAMAHLRKSVRGGGSDHKDVRQLRQRHMLHVPVFGRGERIRHNLVGGQRLEGQRSDELRCVFRHDHMDFCA